MQIFMTVKAARPRLKCGMRCIRCGGNSSIIFGIAGNAATVFQTIASVASIDNIKTREWSEYRNDREGDDVFPSLLVA
jgi:hypothetical protein